MSEAGWTTTSNYAIIATGENFPDALCAAPLAKKYNAPILLTDTDSLKDYTKSELLRLKVSEAIIVGGTGVVTQKVEDAITALGITVHRIAGADRYATSEKVAEEFGTSSNIVVATGENFPDALFVSPIAAMKGMPILLTSRNEVKSEIKPYLDSDKPSSTYVIGGTGAIADSVKRALPNAKRLSGINRYETNTAILNEFSSDLNLANVYLVTGENFPDALSCSALASITSSPMILINNNPDIITKNYINSNFGSIYSMTAIGGTGVLSNNILQNAINNFGITPDYNQVTSLPGYRGTNGDDYYCDSETESIKSYDKNNMNDLNLTNLMDQTADSILLGPLTLSEARDVWVGKYIGNKYRVKSLDSEIIQTSAIGPYLLDTQFIENLKQKGLFDYTLNHSIYYVSYRVYDCLSNQNLCKVQRLIVQMDKIK